MVARNTRIECFHSAGVKRATTCAGNKLGDGGSQTKLAPRFGVKCSLTTVLVGQHLWRINPSTLFLLGNRGDDLDPQHRLLRHYRSPTPPPSPSHHISDTGDGGARRSMALACPLHLHHPLLPIVSYSVRSLPPSRPPPLYH
jgi:hypothetical protein